MGRGRLGGRRHGLAIGFRISARGYPVRLHYWVATKTYLIYGLIKSMPLLVQIRPGSRPFNVQAMASWVPGVFELKNFVHKGELSFRLFCIA